MVGDPRSPSSPPASGNIPAAPRRVLLGELLIESKVITAEQLAEVLAAPREEGKKLGQVLLDRGLITEAQLTQTLSLQLSVPWVSLSHIDFSRQLLNRLPREVSERYCLIPIFVRHVRGQGETLYVAMDDPTNEAAIIEVSRLANLPTRPMIASASDIRSAIRLYYGDPSGVTPSIELPPPPTRVDPPMTTREIRPREGAPPPLPPAAAAGAGSAEPSRSRPPPPPPPPPAAEGAPPATTRSYPPKPGAAAEAAKPAAAAADAPPPPTAAPIARRAKISDEERARRKPRGFNFTFLDGTTIALPQQKKKESTETITTEDLIAALRATLEGKSASAALGEPVNWEPIVAALLALLVRKGLVADWEFIEELRNKR